MTTNARSRTRKWKTKPLRIACWNVRSLSNKDQEIITELIQHRIEICTLSETKKKGKGIQQYNDYILIHSGRDKTQRATSGVGLLVHVKYRHNIQDVQYINDRILKVKLKFKEKYTNIVSVYAPDSSKPIQQAREFFEELQTHIDNIPQQEQLIIMGDLNGRIGRDIIPGIKNKYNEDAINEQGEMIIELCTHNELRINNTFYPHKKQHKTTFKDSRGNESIIDYIITNRTITPSQVLDVRCLTSANINSDHNLVLCKLRIKAPPQKKGTQHQYEKYNIESLVHESTRLLYQNRLEQHITNNSITNREEVNTAWEKIKTNIQKAAEEALGTRKTNTNTRPNRKPWFCTEVKNITAEKKKAYLNYKTKQTPETHATYIRIRNKTNTRIREIKEEYWERFSKEMENDMYGTQKRIWKTLRNSKKEVNEYIQINNITEQEWITYFQALYTNTQNKPLNTKISSNDVNDDNEYNQQDANMNIDITEEQVRRGTIAMKNGKAPGEDNIVNELIKQGGDTLTKELTKLFNSIITTKSIPKEWKKSITVPIFKKGDKKDPANYRGITLLSSPMKLFTSIIAEYIKTEIPLSEEQQGFRKNRSTIDAIFILRQIAEKALEYDTPAYICFIDLTKAFDRVQMTDIIRILREKGMSNSYIKIIEELNTDNITRIKTQYHLTKEIKTTEGIRQGDSLSPLLFNLIMDEIVEEVKNTNKGRGYRLGNQEIRIICYADDAIVLSETEDDLQRLVYAFNKKAKELNMIISTSKTKCMTISKEPLRCKVVVEDKPIEQVMEFNYLGAIISSHGDLANDIKKQINKASRISGHLRHIIWKNKYIKTETKTRIYKTCIRPLLTYAGETRADTTKTKRTLRTSEMKVLRTILGYTLQDRKRNSEIRNKCNTEDIVRWIRKRRRYWNDHVTRMPEQRIAKIVRNGKPHGKRLPGRPRKRWKESWQSISQEQDNTP